MMAPRQILVSPRTLFRCSLLCCILGMLTGGARAQMGGIDPDPGSPGSGGLSTIEGRIHYPSGRAMDKRLRVRLSALRIGEFNTTADDTGAFAFRRLAVGTYTVQIDAGADYEPVNEIVDIYDVRGQARTYSIEISLRLRKGAKSKATVVNASLTDVPKPAVDLYQKGLAAAQAGDTKKAIQELKAAIDVYPGFVAALNELGVLYWMQGDLKDAADVLRSALDYAPNSFTQRLNYGILLVELRQYIKAEAELRRAIELNGNSAKAKYYLGRALANLRRFDDAEKLLQEAVSIGGDEVSPAHRYLGAIYKERGNAKRAVEELELYLKLVPNAKEAEQIRQIISELKNQK